MANPVLHVPLSDCGTAMDTQEGNGADRAGLRDRVIWLNLQQLLNKPGWRNW